MKTNRLFCVLALATFALTACDDKKAGEETKATPEEATKADGEKAEEKKGDKADKADKADPGGHHDHQVMVDPGEEKPEPVSKAIAVMHATKGNTAGGTVVFTQSDKGLEFTSTFTGLKPGAKHAHHIHLYGDCSGDDGKTAGTHFHVKGSSLNPPKDIAYITGNLGDLQADKDGNATLTGTLEGGSLQGKFSVLGRSVIVHEKENDPKAPPIGAAGGRLGCGVIGLTKK